jgi:acetate kinase
MSHDPAHHHHDGKRARCLVITVSDSRTPDTDSGGPIVAQALEASGHAVVGRKLVKDDVAAIRAATLAGVEDEAVDAVVLTGGIGEHAAVVRSQLMGHLAVMGVSEDPQANADHGRSTAGRISAKGSTVVLVVPTDEELLIARDASAVVAAAASIRPA